MRRRETALRQAIAQDQDEDKLLLRAEDVRKARLQLLKARLTRLRFRKGFDAGTSPGTQIEKKIEDWEQMKSVEIIDLYRLKM